MTSLEMELRGSPHCEVITEGINPCIRVGGHYCYPRREQAGQVPAASSPQYIDRYNMTYPVSIIRLLARGELSEHGAFNSALLLEKMQKATEP